LALFFTQDDILKSLNKNNQVVLRYTKEWEKANGEFPFNPNGAFEDIAGVCDPTGRIFGLMPHPERAIFAVNHPDFQVNKEKLLREGREVEAYYEPAIRIFKNAVDYFESGK